MPGDLHQVHLQLPRRFRRGRVAGQPAPAADAAQRAWARCDRRGPPRYALWDVYAAYARRRRPSVRAGFQPD